MKNSIESFELREQKLFWVLSGMLLFLIIAYGVLVNKTIANAVSLQNMQKRMTALNAAVNSLEFTYLNMENGITLDTAHAKGFENVTEDNFALIDSGRSSLSLNAR